MDEYNKLKKKRLEEENKASAKTTNSGMSSYMDTYNKLRWKNNSESIFNIANSQKGGSPKSTKGDETKSKKETEKEERKWFDTSVFDDGYQLWDISKAITGTVTDFGKNIASGIIGMPEKILDAGMTLSAGATQSRMREAANSEIMFNAIFGKKTDESTIRDKYQQIQEGIEKDTAELVAKDLYDEAAVAKAIISDPVKKFTGVDSETDSLLGDKSDSLLESGGQLLGQIGANFALPGSGMALMAATAFGSEAENAFNNGATFNEAVLSSAISAGAEVLTERLGGISFGGKTLTDVAFQNMSRKMTSKLAKALITTGKISMDMTSEGVEEIISGYMSAIGQKLTYMEDKEIEELFSKEDMLESFIGGAVLGGAGSVAGMIQANSKGVDYVTGLTSNEQAVVNKVYEDTIAEKEKNGKLTSKEKNKIYDDVVNQMERGYIDTDTIESVLGGESYKGYQSMLEQETSIKEQQKALQTEIDALQDADNTIRNNRKLQEAEAEMEKLTEQLKSIDVKTAKYNLFDEVAKLTENDTKLRESYNERARRGFAFEADLSQYNAKQQEIVKKAIESGILNNANKTHEFVDFVAKVSADKGVSFDFTNNQKLKESGFAIEGKQVNGFVTKDGITINVNSAKSLDTVVGHEITHVLEGTELYNELQTAIVKYAKDKGDYQGRYDALAKLYENVEGANIDSELTAELVGDYIFTDTDFVNNLSTNHRNVFQKIYNEIKYLYKVATAGSKEARQLEKVKKVFDEAYRNSKNAEITDTKYSISGLNAKTADNSLLLKAENMISEGVDSETVRQETGWYKGYDGQWRFEISDNDMDFNINGHFTNPDVIRHRELEYKFLTEPENITEAEIAEMRSLSNALEGVKKRPSTLGEYLKHDKLFEAYPELKDIKLSFDKLESGVLGKYKFNQNEIVLSNSIREDTEKIKSTLIHEIQHAIQRIEGFTSGSSPKYWETKGIGEAEYESFVENTRREKARILRELSAEERQDYLRYVETDKQIQEILGMSDTFDSMQEDSADALEAIEAENDALYKKLFYTDWFSKLQDIDNVLSEGVSEKLYNEFYKNTAGEIEARDVAKRVNYTNEQRQNIRPDIDRANVTFAKKGDSQFSLSENGTTYKGKFLGKDMALETAPVAEARTEVAESDAPVAETVVETQDEDYAPGESIEEQLAKADDALESLDSETERLFSDLYSQNISEADFETKWRDLDKRYTDARKNQERLSAEMTDINNRKYESIDDSDIPPEMEAPYYGDSESIAPVDPFAERDMIAVGKRNVKAYMTENPEVKPYFQDAARGMLFDLQNGVKGERLYNDQLYYETGGEKGWMGTKRRTTDDIADLLDQWGYTYDQIEAGLNAIIEDDGKVNNAVSKRIEFMLDNRLRNGYTDVEGRPYPADEGYINLLKEKQIDDYRRESFDSFMEVADQYAPAEDIAPLEIEPATEGEQNVLDGFEQTEQEQAPERLTRSKLHSQIVGNVKAEFAQKGYDLDEVLDNAHRMNVLAVNDNTPQRVNDKTFGYEAGELLNELTFNRVALRESEGVKWLNEQVDTIRNLSKKYKIKPLSKESSAAQMYAEGFWVNDNNEIVSYGDAELAQDFPDVDVQRRIKALANDPTIRKIYDDTLDAINESRTRNAYPEIPRLENYYLHFRAMDDTFSRLGIPFNPNNIRANDLPTDINGTTIDRKPGQPFFVSSMHREGKRTSFDLFGGLERYLNSAKNQIYHIDDIQTERALWGYIADRYGQAHGLENLDDMEFEAQQEHIQKVYDGHLSNYARFLMEHANNLAGKTALIDRGVEGLVGRRALQFINTVNTQTSRNQVGYSVSSPLTNFIPTMEAIARTPKRDSIKAFAQTISNVFRKDGFVENDPTLIRRKGVDKFSKTLWEKLSDPGYILMGAVDDVSSQFIVRTKYNELTRKGMDSEQAHIKAGEWAMRIMGDRSLGQMPLVYNSKFMGLFTKYQLEVRNQLDSAFYDTYQEAKSNTEIEDQKAKNAVTAAKFAYKAAQIAVLNHVFGMAFQKIAGYNPAFDIVSTIATLFGWDDDEEDEDTVLDNVKQAKDELLGDLPYVSIFTGGGRIPVSGALPIKEALTGKDEYGNEKALWQTLAEAAPYYLLPGGYNQIKKTTQGLGMFSDEHPVSGSYTSSGNLRFPVEETFGNKLQAALFGQYASENARDYFDNERMPLKEKQVQEFIDVDIPIQDYWDYREGLAKFDNNEDKVEYIDSLDLPLSKKNILVNNVLDRKEEVDLENYSDYGSLAEFDFAVKYPEKYQFLEDNGVTYEQYSKFDDDTKDAYNWAFENPEKYTMSQAISDDLVEYKSYTKGLDDIKADKDENGKSINGSRKEKVFSYIESLPLDYGQKCILFKSQYKSDDSMNMDIIEYLDSREDIDYDEMVTILKELDFTVEGNNVYWD
jgi:ribosomal protein S11